MHPDYLTYGHKVVAPLMKLRGLSGLDFIFNLTFYLTRGPIRPTNLILDILNFRQNCFKTW